MHRRHELTWLTAAGWRAARDAALPQHAASLERWQQRDWPAVVRRDDPDIDTERQLCVGIALPPDADGMKVRIPLRVELAEIARRAPALSLKAARAALPVAWQAAYAELELLATGLDLQVFGSLSWQALTGQTYLTASSDIDLLLQPMSERQLRSGLALLHLSARALPLDGEVMFPSGQAVAWKEWLVAEAGQARVLVKERGAVRLAQPDALLATLRQSC